MLGWRSLKASEREDTLFKIHEGHKGLSLCAGFFAKISELILVELEPHG